MTSEIPSKYSGWRRINSCSIIIGHPFDCCNREYVVLGLSNSSSLFVPLDTCSLYSYASRSCHSGGMSSVGPVSLLTQRSSHHTWDYVCVGLTSSTRLCVLSRCDNGGGIYGRTSMAEPSTAEVSMVGVSKAEASTAEASTGDASTARRQCQNRQR